MNYKTQTPIRLPSDHFKKQVALNLLILLINLIIKLVRAPFLGVIAVAPKLVVKITKCHIKSN
jgi:hypothetical protein